MGKISPLRVRDNLQLIIMNTCAVGLLVLLVNPSFTCSDLIEGGGGSRGDGLAAILAVLCVGITRYGVAAVTLGLMIYGNYRYFKTRQGRQ